MNDQAPTLPFMPTPEERPGFEEATRLQVNIDKLLAAIGDTGTCRGCGAKVAWVLHKNGKKAPYDADAVNHFITCPQRDRFRTGGTRAAKEGTD